jgi:hypothetical protein
MCNDCAVRGWDGWLASSLCMGVWVVRSVDTSRMD